MWTIREYLYKFQEILFPTKCFSCEKNDEIICDSCLQKCRKNVDFLGLYTVSVYSFKDPLIKKIVHALKYYRRKDLATPLAKEMSKELGSYIGTNYILVPIPMYRLRKYIRGYNQAEILAENISKLISIPANNNLLKRIKLTKRQVEVNNRALRINNPKNSFDVTKSVKDMNIIIVDDVTTTGATINEARRILLKEGARDVRAITIAH
ncbi:MAG: ComF family protein [Candidatus Taylorbacteria bacterium]|nr:ComF family protein [Candidatus Taylorbacteria bacterium]